MTITKGCPRCGADLDLRSTMAGTEYLGCTRPGCKHREPLPVDQTLRAQGWPMLPGLRKVAVA